MSETVLKGKVRETGKKGPARRLRTEGLLPGIVYGLGDNVPITVDAKAVKKILEVKGGVNNILKTKFEGDKKERTVMIKFLDVHPIYDTLLHIDLIEVDVTKKIKTSVALEFTGVSKGVKLGGGRMNLSIRSLSIECLPADIPATIEVPIEDMDVGDSLRIKNLKVDSAIKVINDPELVVINIAEPKAEAVAEEAEGAEAPEGEAAKESSGSKEKDSSESDKK